MFIGTLYSSIIQISLQKLRAVSFSQEWTWTTPEVHVRQGAPIQVSCVQLRLSVQTQRRPEETPQKNAQLHVYFFIIVFNECCLLALIFNTNIDENNYNNLNIELSFNAV